MSERGLAFVVVVLVAVCGFAAALAWGLTGVVVLFALVVLWLLWYVGSLVSLIEETRADIDEHGDGIEAIKAHLTGNDEPSTGRHSGGEPATYRPGPFPRSDSSRRSA